MVGAIASKALIKDGLQLGIILVVHEQLGVETGVQIDGQGLEYEWAGVMMIRAT